MTQKRGFKTSVKRLHGKHEMMLQKGNKLDMTFESFYEMYSEYKRQRVKESTFETKSHIVRTKKEILDEGGNLWSGCKIIKKGEVYETNFFQAKKEEFKSHAFLENMKQVMTDAINEIVKDENEKLQVFQKGSPYLATKRSGKQSQRSGDQGR